MIRARAGYVEDLPDHELDQREEMKIVCCQVAALKPEPQDVSGELNCWEFHQAVVSKFEQEKLGFEQNRFAQKFPANMIAKHVLRFWI